MAGGGIRLYDSGAVGVDIVCRTLQAPLSKAWLTSEPSRKQTFQLKCMKTLETRKFRNAGFS